MGSLAWIFDDSIQPAWAVEQEQRINQRIDIQMEVLVATLQEALDGWRAYTDDLKAQLAVATQGLADAAVAAQLAADTLAAFQADDAATDASQLAAQAQADADAVQAALEAAQAPVEEPPVLEEPVDPPVEEPPVEEPPVV